MDIDEKEEPIAVERAINQDPGTLSPFERLPSELVCEIINFAPETILNLRLASRIFQSRVDVYALQIDNVIKQIKVVDKGFDFVLDKIKALEIVEGAEAQANDPSEIRVKLIAHEQMERFLSLRVILHCRPFDLRKLRKICIRRNERGRIPINEFSYTVDFKSLNEDERSRGLRSLGECLGQHIGNVEFWLSQEWNELPIVGSLFDGMHITSVKINHRSSLSKDVANQLLRFSKEHDINNINMVVRQVDPTLDSVRMLLELSTVVRTMHIQQRECGEMEKFAHLLLGIHNADFGPTIIEMLSRKLDKLSISNYYQHLKKRSADLLIERLPNMGKAIWFSTTSNKSYYSKGLDYYTNDHWISAVNSHLIATLRIFHSSRRHEYPWLDNA